MTCDRFSRCYKMPGPHGPLGDRSPRVFSRGRRDLDKRGHGTSPPCGSRAARGTPPKATNLQIARDEWSASSAPIKTPRLGRLAQPGARPKPHWAAGREELIPVCRPMRWSLWLSIADHRCCLRPDRGSTDLLPLDPAGLHPVVEQQSRTCGHYTARLTPPSLAKLTLPCARPPPLLCLSAETGGPSHAHPGMATYVKDKDITLSRLSE
jgi:hypothetical protein